MEVHPREIFQAGTGAQRGVMAGSLRILPRPADRDRL